MTAPRRIALVVALTLAAAAAAVFALLLPYVQDDWALDRVVLSVALDWRDFGRETAERRLQYELDHQRIGGHVRDEDCGLVEAEAELRVRCAWTVPVALPGVAVQMPLSFASAAVITADGDLQAR